MFLQTVKSEKIKEHVALIYIVIIQPVTLNLKRITNRKQGKTERRLTKFLCL